MNDALRQKAQNLMTQCTTLTLATQNNERPFAASLFFAGDTALNLYFISGADTQHIRNLTLSDQVAVTIHPECHDWFAIRGLQITGHIAKVEDSERQAILELYLDKFPQIRQLAQQPANNQEKIIGERLLASDFYRITPKWLRLIDNSESFGFKEEMTL